MKIKLKREINSKGHLSAHLVQYHPDGSQTWTPYDTRTATEDPTDGFIIVFNSQKSEYEKADSLKHARELFAGHIERLTRLVPEEKVKPVTGTNPDTSNIPEVTPVVIL